MGKTLSSVGGIILLYAVVSAVITFFNYELKVFMWIYNWGEGNAWLIRGGAAVLGIILLLIGSKLDDSQEK